jgi:hypothetical protein
MVAVASQSLAVPLSRVGISQGFGWGSPKAKTRGNQGSERGRVPDAGVCPGCRKENEQERRAHYTGAKAPKKAGSYQGRGVHGGGARGIRCGVRGIGFGLNASLATKLR